MTRQPREYHAESFKSRWLKDLTILISGTGRAIERSREGGNTTAFVFAIVDGATSASRHNFLDAQGAQVEGQCRWTLRSNHTSAFPLHHSLTFDLRTESFPHSFSLSFRDAIFTNAYRTRRLPYSLLRSACADETGGTLST